MLDTLRRWLGFGATKPDRPSSAAGAAKVNAELDDALAYRFDAEGMFQETDAHAEVVRDLLRRAASSATARDWYDGDRLTIEIEHEARVVRATCKGNADRPEWCDTGLVLLALNEAAEVFAIPFRFAALPTEDQTAKLAAIAVDQLRSLRQRRALTLEGTAWEKGYSVTVRPAGSRDDAATVLVGAGAAPRELDPLLVVDCRPIALAAPVRIDGMLVKRRMTYDESGHIGEATLAEVTRVGVFVAAEATAISMFEGIPQQLTLGEVAVCDGVELPPKTRLEFWEDGTLMQAKVSKAIEIRGRQFPAKTTFDFSEAGALHYATLPNATTFDWNEGSWRERL